jgi:hypothetical protein
LFYLIIQQGSLARGGLRYPQTKKTSKEIIIKGNIKDNNKDNNNNNNNNTNKRGQKRL